MESARNRPEELMPNALAQPVLTPKIEMMRRTVGELIRKGFPPPEIAALVLSAIRSDVLRHSGAA